MLNNKQISTHFAGRRVVVIAPHNDDEVIGCWFFLKALSSSADIHVVVVTFHEDDDALVCARQRETREALSMIGVSEPEYWNIPDGRVKEFSSVISARLEGVDEHADYVLCPAPNDVTPDHVPIGNAALAHVNKRKVIWYRSTWWTFPIQNADFIVKGGFFEKITVIKLFKSQRKIALSRSVGLSFVECVLKSLRVSACEAFMFADEGRLSDKPLNSISLKHVLRVFFWK